AGSRRIEVRALRRDCGELVRRDHADAPALEPNPPALGPCPQLLVGALARHPDHLADLALGDGRLARRRRALYAPGQLQQGLRQASRQVQERDVLHLLAGAAQPRAENLDELEHHVRLTAQERNEIAPLDDDELAVGHGGRVRGARAAVEQGDFPENIALAKDVEHDVLAVGGSDADFHRAGEHAHEPGSRVAFGEDGRPARRPPRLHVRAEVLDHAGRKIAKQRMAAEQGQLVTRAFALLLGAWTRHEGPLPVANESCNRRLRSSTLGERSVVETLYPIPAMWPVFPEQMAACSRKEAKFGNARCECIRPSRPDNENPLYVNCLPLQSRRRWQPRTRANRRRGGPCRCSSFVTSWRSVRSEISRGRRDAVASRSPR